MGHIINDFHKNRCCELLRDHEGTVVVGNGNAHEDKNITPTVIVNPNNESPLMKEEIFGPILPVITFTHIEEAIKFVNDRDKPLSLYYFGKAHGSNC